jgi:hypothetical protein
MKYEGFSYLRGGVLSTGEHINGVVAGARGLARGKQWPAWLAPIDGALPLTSNLVLDTGRQYAMYALGGKTPSANYCITHFGVGTGTTPPTTGDSALEAPVELTTGFLKPVDSIDFPAPFTLRINYTLGLADANGYLLTEVGFYAGNGTLLIRATRLGISKVSDWSPALSHCLVG